MDATLQTLERFADPTQWEIVPDVPIFTVHRVVKRGPDGKAQPIDVSESDLKKIVQTARRLEEATGVCPRITQGHMHLTRETPEQQQPPPIGWGRNLRVAPWGPANKPGVLCDLWFERGKKPARGDYPYRSVEYYPDTHEITGIALLRRDPELDLGLVTYERGAPAFCYSKETDMADDMNTPPAGGKPDLDPTSQPDATAPDPEFQEHFMRCMRHSFPHLEKMHAAHAAQYEAAAAPAMPSPTNGSIPAPAGKEDGMAYLRRTNPIEYQRVTSALSEVATLRGEVRLAQYERELRDLVEAGYPVDVRQEIQYCKDSAGNVIAPDQFARDKERLMQHLADRVGPANYGRGIPALSIAEAGRQPNQQGELTEQQLDRAVQYARDKGCTWREAEEWARKNAS